MAFTSLIHNFSLLKIRLFFPVNRNKERAVRGLRLWQGPVAGRVLTLICNPCLNTQGLCFYSFRVLGKHQIHVLTKRLGSRNLPVHWITKSVVSKGSSSNLTFCWDSCKDYSPLEKKKSNKKISDLRRLNVGSIFACIYKF